MPQFFIGMLETRKANINTLKIDYFYVIKYFAKYAKTQSENATLFPYTLGKSGIKSTAAHAQVVGQVWHEGGANGNWAIWIICFTYNSNEKMS